MTPLEEIQRQEIARLKKENQALVAENAKLKHSELEEAHRKILKALESADANCKASDVAAEIGTDAGHTHYLLNWLRDQKYVYEVATGFHIDDKGIEALHKSLS